MRHPLRLTLARAAPWSVALILCSGATVTPPTIVANTNRVPAGRLDGGTLTVRLVAREGLWYPDENQSPPLPAQAFAEQGRAPSIPGPLIRVREGTRVRAVVRNALAVPLVVRGLQTRPAAMEDTLRIAPGATREVTFDAGPPGTYLYWASTADTANALTMRVEGDTQLNGVIVVDPASGPVPDDRIFVITGIYLAPDTTAAVRRDERFLVALNGRSWPHTERLTYAEGDTVHWRLVNASFEPHPMHLHGFFFRIVRSGGPLADTVLPRDASRLAVTEAIEEGGTRAIDWVPERPGNWLLHCHLQVHVDPGVVRVPFPAGSGRVRHLMGNHAVDGMAGLAVGVHVTPAAGTRVFVALERRPIRMVVQHMPREGRSRIAVGITDPAHGASGAMTSPGAPVILRVGEPARITVVNRLTEPTAIHWHGLELDSYYDGVAGWSGDGRRLAPLIAPGDSFTANITPVRPGTYIYHSHVEDTHQRGDGLYGALIVLDSGERWDPVRNLVFILGGREIEDTLPPLLNGSVTPAPLDLAAGTSYRLRLINIMENNGPFMRLMIGDSLARWRALARDAAPLPRALAVAGPSRAETDVGTTFDFEFVPEHRDYRFEIQRRNGRVTNTQLLRVARAP